MLWLLAGYTPVYSQQKLEITAIDSLSAVYRSNLNSQPKIAKQAALAWLEAAKNSNDQLQQAQAHYALANLGNSAGDYQSTVANIQETIKILKALNQKDGLSASYNLLALGYKNMAEYPKAMDNFLNCLKFAEKENNREQQANAYQNIATLYILQEDYKKAAENLDRAADLFRELKDDDGVLTTLFNFANILKEQGKFKEARKHYQTVLKYRKREGNKSVIAYVNMNLSQMLLEEKKYHEALIALKKTLGLLQALQFKSDIAVVYNDLGLCESKLRNTQKAIFYFEKALKIGEEQALLQYNSEIYSNISQLYNDQKNYKKALAFYQKAVATEEQHNSLNKEKYVAKLQERYETQLKETRIKLLEKEQKLSDAELQKAALTVKRQRVVRNAFIAGFVLVLLTLILLRLFYIQRLRIQKQLSTQKEENARQRINQMMQEHKLSVIKRYQEGQEEERSRLARDIHDGIGSDLAGIKIAFEHYLEGAGAQPNAKRLLGAISNVCIDVRTLSHQLHPLPFSKIGFSSFLNEFIDQVTQKNQLKIQTFLFPEEEIDELPDELLADTYRIVQELINNILKHAEATSAELQLTKHEDHLNIVINDNGKGFQKTKKQGIGLRNIRERLQKVNGTLDIDSSSGSGTSITIDIPLNATF
ncbi:tetratricopeptide repeat-containing sensor histidine kinase [Zunongwangia sp. HRR-M8]|uniref:tetratricopeptide repeat-containing sensor histidine kinase n=1 Tax=Zunongwangia sp. HRR-M8 TaxID=3015170 RepID=UPI0022DD7ABC|nr:tetratricopeptide repeat protein [Zunongwangia sp. HRR-M8]WBL21130.1 tetratricopeptide repeat protein [Zunongwangia sp. HRR-M8]